MIHYHGSPISGGIEAQFAFKGRHAMISYANRKNTEQIIELCQSFTFDNGAYSFWSNNTEFPIDGFAEWISEYHRHPDFDWYCLPDVIDGDHNDNRKMRARWFNLVSSDIWHKGYPVWHLHEPISVLQEMLAAWRGICLGSSGEYSQIGTEDWWGRMAEAMEVLTDDAGRPICKIHGLRMLDNTLTSVFPFSSADSTNAARNAHDGSRWRGYRPASSRTRALILMERIEDHATASRWSGQSQGGKNYELFG